MMMGFAKKMHLSNSRVLAFMAGALLVILTISTAGHAAGPELGKRLSSAPPLDVPQRPLQAIQSSPLVAGGVKLGTAVLYDDPSTRRGADYLELYDGQGGLVAVSWFDRFGIQRIAVDRAFLDGEERLEGVFVAVVDDNFI
jgi:hypothetical protein